MKDWNLAPCSWTNNRKRKNLVHKCVLKEPFHRGMPWYRCQYNSAGFWFCPRCWERAPEEMGFVADLARCVR